MSNDRGRPRGPDIFIASTKILLAASPSLIYSACYINKEATMAEFTGKNILVLGGSRGIGAAIVRRFAQGGANVAFTYAGSKAAAEALAAETGAEALHADSADRDALLATVAGRGALDVLVANAGTLVLGDPLTLDADTIDRM